MTFSEEPTANPMPRLHCDRCASLLGQDQIGYCDDCRDASRRRAPNKNAVDQLARERFDDYANNLKPKWSDLSEATKELWRAYAKAGVRPAAARP